MLLYSENAPFQYNVYKVIVPLWKKKALNFKKHLELKSEPGATYGEMVSLLLRWWTWYNTYSNLEIS